MTANDVFLASLATIGHSTTSGGTYTPVAHILKFTSPKAETAKIKLTDMDTPDQTHEYGAGFTDPGDVELDCNMSDADFVALKELQQSGVTVYWKTIFNNGVGTGEGTTIVVAGFVVSVVAEANDPAALVTHKLKIAHTGKETITAAS